MMKKPPLVFSAYTMCFALVSIPSLADVSEKIEQTYSVNHGSEFRLNNLNGSVNITTWSHDEIKVTALKRAETQERLNQVTITFEQQGSSVSVETKYHKHEKHNHQNSGSVMYDVLLPEHIHTTDVDLVNGSIKVQGAIGNSYLKSVNGSIKVDYQRLAHDVDEIKLKTVNGSIKLYLPDSTNAEIEAETIHGSLKSTFDAVGDKNSISGKQMNGTIGSGHTKVKLESVNGSIKVMKNNNQGRF